MRVRVGVGVSTAPPTLTSNFSSCPSKGKNSYVKLWSKLCARTVVALAHSSHAPALMLSCATAPGAAAAAKSHGCAPTTTVDVACAAPDSKIPLCAVGSGTQKLERWWVSGSPSRRLSTAPSTE